VQSYQDNKRGIVALIAACALYTINDTLTKLSALAYPTGEVMFLRGVICLICVGAIIVYARQLLTLRYAAHPTVALRAVLDAASNIFFVMALSRMRIADLLAVNLVSPLLVTMLLAFFFKEPIGWRRWSAILVGFAGTLLIVKPSPASFNIWALVAFLAACASATRDITTRRINPGIPTLTITFVSLLATTLSSLLLAIVAEESWRQPETEYAGFIGVAAVVLSVGSVLAGLDAFLGGARLLLQDVGRAARLGRPGVVEASA
jgi:drug/metabolite transporter (DMT)-like permease